MVNRDKIKKAKKKIKEAEDCVFDAAEDADDDELCQKSLTQAERDLEKAEAELDDADEY